MKNKFYVISTPIGNIQEVNQRMINALKECKYLLSEDTRVTQKFLRLIDFQGEWPTLISYHKFNEKNKLNELLELIENNCCGLVSDAGYPAISDPGQIIIQALRENLPTIQVEVINCANAAICALVGSGFINNSFYFAGFLDKKTTAAIKQLQKLKTINSTLILYESVHRIQTTLECIDSIFSSQQICVARELTKQNETYYFGTAKQIGKELTLKGEFVIIIDNNSCESKQIETLNDSHLQAVTELENLGVKTKLACKYVADKHQLNNSTLYNQIQKLKNNKK